MTKMLIRLQNDLENRQERGAAMAEYGLLLALVALAAIVVLATFGDRISAVFTSADEKLEEGLNKANGTGGAATTTTGGAATTTGAAATTGA